MSERKAWFCPSCQKHHGPHVDTCPSGEGGTDFKQPVVPFPPYFGPSNVCGKCGIRLDSTMSYCCPQPDCPCGLGLSMCTAGFPSNPNVKVMG